MEPPPEAEVQRVVRLALDEDIGSGDITTLATVPEGTEARFRMVAREELVVAGLGVAERVFREVSGRARVTHGSRDGELAHRGRTLLEITGPAGALLTAERVALNFVQRLAGIATLTRRFVEAVAGIDVRILDTRKTTPGLRFLEKYAVACGGGLNHRSGLFDQVLIKDNHLASLRQDIPNPIASSVARVRSRYPGHRIEVEADTLEQVDQALAAGAEIILLDNMSLEELREAVRKARGRARTEASGGVTLANVRAIAETGVDSISVGALTHSAPAVDVALDFEM